MNEVTMTDVYTVAGIAEKFGLSQAVIRTAIAGLSPALSVNGGRGKLYTVQQVRNALMDRNWALLEALGYVSQTGQAEDVEFSQETIDAE